MGYKPRNITGDHHPLGAPHDLQLFNPPVGDWDSSNNIANL